MADNTSQIAGLFMTPELYQQQQTQQALKQAAELAQLTPEQRANTMLGFGGYQLAGGIAQALGAQDPMLQAISQQQSILKNVDFTNAQSLGEAARQATAMGRPDIAQQLASRAIEIQSKIDEKQAARDQALQVAKMQIDARVEAAKQAGADRLLIAQMQIEGRKELASLAAALKQGQQAGKPLSTQDIKMANELTAAVKDADFGIAEATRFTDLIDKGAMKFGMVENAMSAARSAAGKANPSDLAKSDLEKWVTSSINAVLNQAKGVQAKDDAERAQKQVMAALDKNDPNLIRQGVQRIKKLLENTKDDAMSGLQLMSQERNRDLTGRIPSNAGTKENPIVLK